MTLSVDDEITLVEVAVILLGIAVTWAVYRHGKDGNDPSMPRPGPARGREPEIADEDAGTIE